MSDQLQITKVIIYPFEQEGFGDRNSNLLAYADVVLNEVLQLKGFKIFRSKTGGLFIGFPAQRAKNGQYYEQIVALTKEMKVLFREHIISAYKERE
ncbi:septation protein SpoVG family protein [bacterium]|nr:septation protein SpoVG family protein [bacterium]